MNIDQNNPNTAYALSRMSAAYKEATAGEKMRAPNRFTLHFATESHLLDYNVFKMETGHDPLLSRTMSCRMIDHLRSKLENLSRI